MVDNYQLIRIKEDTLYIIDRGLTREEVEGYILVRDEDDCDRITPSEVYAVSDSDMSRIFGR